MSELNIINSEVDFYIPAAGQPCKAWYMLVGNLKLQASWPFAMAYGGPGISHDSILSIAA